MVVVIICLVARSNQKKETNAGGTYTPDMKEDIPVVESDNSSQKRRDKVQVSASSLTSNDNVGYPDLNNNNGYYDKEDNPYYNK